MATTARRLGALVFPGFELLDVFGPLEMFGYVPGLEIQMIGTQSGAIASAQGPRVWADGTLEETGALDILLIPGGRGTRTLAEKREFVESLAELARRSDLVLSVCTGSGLLARTGLLDGRRATSNKAALDWAATQGPKVQWQPSARWVREGSIVTSSGVAPPSGLVTDTAPTWLTSWPRGRPPMPFASYVPTPLASSIGSGKEW